MIRKSYGQWSETIKKYPGEAGGRGGWLTGRLKGRDSSPGPSASAGSREARGLLQSCSKAAESPSPQDTTSNG